jgi:hypothetical protein
MSKQVAKGCVHLVIIIMIMECFLACFATPSSSDVKHKSFRAKTFSPFLIPLLSEGGEEKSEKESDKSLTKLADFSQITFFLSNLHERSNHFVVFEHPDNYRLPLFKLFRAFII